MGNTFDDLVVEMEITADSARFIFRTNHDAADAAAKLAVHGVPFNLGVKALTDSTEWEFTTSPTGVTTLRALS